MPKRIRLEAIRHHRVLLAVCLVAMLLIVMIPAYLFFDLASREERVASRDTQLSIRDNKDALRVSISGMITPKRTFTYYAELLRYLSEELGRPVTLIQRRSYRDVNLLLREGKADLAFVCSGGYVELSPRDNVELLVVPVSGGRSVYYSYIIVRKDSGISSFGELASKRFAFTDPLSASGRLYPVYLIKKKGLTPEKYFSKFIYTYNHDNSVAAVRQGVVDGAAVDSLMYEYLMKRHPQEVRGLKIIEKSPSFGIPPVVVRADLDSGLKNRLREIFLNMNKTGRGRQILSHLLLDGFQPGDDSMYHFLRQMKSFVDVKSP